jgi:signal transduction histidine kinase
MAVEHHVLLIEDNDVDAAVFERYVTAMPGWTLTRTRSLEEAEEEINRVGASWFHLAAVDLTLPDAVDLESIAFAREFLPQAACVAVTARNPAEVDERALRAGAADLLVKMQMNARGVQRALSHAVERNELVRWQLDSERNLRSVLGAWNDALFVVDESRKVLFRNDAAANYADAMTMDRGQRFVVPIDPGDVLQVDLPRPGGEPIPIELRSWRITWANEPARVIILRDRFAERAAERARARIEEAERRAHLGEGAMAGVHDIGNRVTAMIAVLQDAQAALGSTAPDRDERLARALATLDESCNHIAGVARNSRRAAHDVRHVRAPIDVAAFVRTCCDAMRSSIEPSARLRLQLEPAAEVLGDPVALGRVIDNLLANAVQAIGTGAPDRNEIRVSVRQEGDRVLVEVADTGPGVPDAVRERLFERHFTTKATGTGLGLANVRDIVTEHGGTIELSPATGQGACFVVSLPGIRARVSSVRILMVEDRPEVARANQRILSGRYHVDLAVDGREALDRIQANAPYSVILCDLDMPGMDGREFFETLAADRPELTQRVVFCSGGATSDELDLFLNRTGRPCLPKPIDLGEAIAAIDAAAGPDL